VRAGRGCDLRRQKAGGGDASHETAPPRSAARRQRRRGRAVAIGAGRGGKWHAPSSGVVWSASWGNGVREGGVSTPGNRSSELSVRRSWLRLELWHKQKVATQSGTPVGRASVAQLLARLLKC
jgi:hypothetical protein